MKKLILMLALASVATGVTAATSTAQDAIYAGPSTLQKDATYMVIKKDGSTIIQYFSDPKDCDRFAPKLKGECLSGEETIKRYPHWVAKN